jgi:transcriptional regulator with GAF, ATPase, and Fis domain
LVERDVTLSYPLEAPSPRASARLQFTDARGRQERVVEAPLVIGSADAAGIVLKDKTISRAHAALEPRNDGLWVRDLGSRNGTFVGDVRVESARLPEGGRLRLGGFELLVRYAPQTATPEVWPAARFGDLLGRTAVMRELFAKMARYAPTDFPVLIQGETGTGKELVARALHEGATGRSGPFVVVDCGALPSTLLDSELFGHARGAFTGADGDRAGAFEAAHGGTVFLDEIGELPLALQPKLLRVLETKTVRRVGESHYRPVDIRFLSATHRDLRGMVAARSFREDLFFRLSVLVLGVPPLRDRRGDVPLLLDSFLYPRTSAEIDPSAMRALLDRPWPGNVRELRNFADRLRALGIEQATALLDEESAETRVFAGAGIATSMAAAGGTPDEASLAEPFKAFRERWIEDGERAYVSRALAQSGGNIAAAARAAGVDRTYLFRLVRKLGLG